MRLCTNPSSENVSTFVGAWWSLWAAFCDLLGSFGTPWDLLGDPFGHLGVTWGSLCQPKGALGRLWGSILADFGTFVPLWAQKLIQDTEKHDFSMVWDTFYQPLDHILKEI